MSEQQLAGQRWETPPAQHQRHNHPDWAAVAARLRKNPGKWLLVFEQGSAAVATAMATDRIACHCLRPEDGFEWQTANNTRTYPRTCDLYMRWVDPADKD